MVKGGRERERENENGDRKVEERIKYVYAVQLIYEMYRLCTKWSSKLSSVDFQPSVVMAP